MGKSKGSAGERDISRFFTMGLTGQNKELFFGRSPGSGSVATVNIGNKAISGDIIALKSGAKLLIDRFSLELKTGYKGVSLDKHLKYNVADPLKAFGIQAVDDATQADKLPLLIYKKLGFKTPGLGIEPVFNQHVAPHTNQLRFVHLRGDTEYPDTYFYEFYEFGKLITPEILESFK